MNRIESNLSNMKNERSKKVAVRMDRRSSVGAAYIMSQRWLCQRFRLTDKTETIIGKVNNHRPINDKMEGRAPRRKNVQAKQATKSRG